jgi:hypothetical protein
MGNVTSGIPKDITILLKEISNINLFIETGTFYGETTKWAAGIFKNVKTIEFSENIFLNTKSTYSYLSNVEFIYGDSRKELRKIIENNNEPAIFWLDAHWCSMGTYGESDQCPLLEELDIICSNNLDHIVLIDDARLFLSPPPLPHSTKYYPSIAEIIHKFNQFTYYILIFEDVIICIPNKYKDNIVSDIQQKNTVKENFQEKHKALRYIKRKIKRYFK